MDEILRDPWFRKRECKERIADDGESEVEGEARSEKSGGILPTRPFDRRLKTLKLAKWPIVFDEILPTRPTAGRRREYTKECEASPSQ